MNWINFVAYGVIVLWTITAIIFVIKANKKYTSVNPYIFDSVPGIFTTLGIFGTFLGITYSLYAFDVKNIEGSMPGLLTGMKTAFLTSIFGIVLSFIFAKYVSIAQKKGDSELKLESEEVIKLGELIKVLKDSIDINRNSFDELRKAISSNSDDSLSTHFVKLRTMFKDESQDTRTEITKIVNSLGGDSDTSILTQIQRLRSDMDSNKNIYTDIKNSLNKFSENSNTHLLNIDNNIKGSSDLIATKFDEFTKLLEKSNTEALVKAIENVIGGFNERLNELLERLVKENFEELNNSVKQLNSWQIENKEMIIRLTSQFKDVSDNLQVSGKTLTSISNSTKQLVSDDSVLIKLVKELERVMIENTTFRESIVMLNTTTLELQDSSKLLNNWMKREEKFAEAVKNLIVSLNAIEDLKNQSGQMWNDIKTNLNQGSQVLKDGSKELLSHVQQLDSEFHNRMNQSFMSLDKILQAMVTEYHNRANILKG